MKEVWKDIKGYEGIYQVSSRGRVKSLSRTIIDTVGRVIKKKEKILSFRISSCTGYPMLNLFKDGKRTTVTVHRLVAEAFIPNPKNLPCVNHRDESRDNNHVDNLEWCTYKYNNSYGTVRERQSKSLNAFFASHQEYLRPIVQYSLTGDVVRCFKSIAEAEKHIGIDNSSIRHCCKNRVKIAYGYVWRYKDDPFSLEEYKPKRHQKFVIKRDLEGNEVARYSSMSVAAKSNGFNRHRLQKARIVNGFQYEVEQKNQY